MVQYRVDRFQEIVDQSRMPLIGEQETRRRERLEQLHQSGGSLDPDIA
jgi:hypothetical protein